MNSQDFTTVPISDTSELGFCKGATYMTKFRAPEKVPMGSHSAEVEYQELVVVDPKCNGKLILVLSQLC